MRGGSPVVGILFCALVLVVAFAIPHSEAEAATQMPIQIRNIVNMDSPSRVSSEKRFSEPSTQPSIPPVTFGPTGFSNTTINRGNSQLVISTGVVKGVRITYLQYAEITSAYSVTIMDSVATNPSTGSTGPSWGSTRGGGAGLMPSLSL